MRILYLSFLIIFADQCSKILVKGFNASFLDISFDGLLYGVRNNIFGSYLNFTFVENPGIAFGIELPALLKILLSVSSGLISIALIIYLYKQRKEKLLFRLSLALIIGGAFGNFIDRVFYGIFYGYAPLFFGKVVDFIEIKFFPVSLLGYSFDHLPIFNIADLAVAFGVMILIFFHKTILPDAQSNINTDQSVNIETYTVIKPD